MKIVFSAMLFLALVACEKGAEATATPATAAASVTAGQVLETIDVDSYTYIRLATDGQEVWLATSPILVEQGDFVQFAGGMMMQDFHSTSLDRTFDQILFVGHVEPAGSGATAGALTSSIPPGGADPHAGLDLAPVAAENPDFIEAPDGAYSIAEILAEPAKFEGKKINLRAKVIKVNDNIMGKNWVTLQDGTGSAPNDRLTVTTLQTVTVGEERTFTAVVRTDLDLGQGYNYKVLLENATFE